MDKSSLLLHNKHGLLSRPRIGKQMGIRRKNITAKQRSDILADLQNGYDVRATAKRRGVSVSSVYKTTRRLRKFEQPPHQQFRAQLHRQHQEELVYFGQRLRDRLSLERPSAVVRLDVTPLTWCGKPLSIDTPAPRGAEEKRVESTWGFGRFDARAHPLFEPLKQHLSGNPCWQSILGFDNKSKDYYQACQRAYEMVLKKTRRSMPKATDMEAASIARSLTEYAWRQAAFPDTARIEFDYTPQRAPGGEGWYYLQLAYVGIGHEHNPEHLGGIAAAHRRLTAELPSTPEITKANEAYRAASAAMNQFRTALSPDARLRKLLVDGRCDLCVLR